jgi:benzoyl-CoA 2,3-dioxygenase component B
MPIVEDGRVLERDIPLRNAMNEVLRDAWVKDNQRGCDRWNKIVHDAGIDRTLTLPDKRFNRKMGIYAGHHFDLRGNPISSQEFERRRGEWLPTESDRAWVRQLMQPVLERGKMANWIAAPLRGINDKPIDFEYVRRV